MSDLSKCHGTDCSRKEHCLRFTSIARPIWQAYLCMQVSIKDVELCKWFVANNIDNEEKSE